jgi:hypothetical protein
MQLAGVPFNGTTADIVLTTGERRPWLSCFDRRTRSFSSVVCPSYMSDEHYQATEKRLSIMCHIALDCDVISYNSIGVDETNTTHTMFTFPTTALLRCFEDRCMTQVGTDRV